MPSEATAMNSAKLTNRLEATVAIFTGTTTPSDRNGKSIGYKYSALELSFEKATHP